MSCNPDTESDTHALIGHTHTHNACNQTWAVITAVKIYVYVCVCVFLSGGHDRSCLYFGWTLTLTMSESNAHTAFTSTAPCAVGSSVVGSFF